jgi:hypothetical protein
LSSVRVLWIDEKSVIRLSPKSGNSPYSSLDPGVLTSVNSIGLLVTMLEPLGRNSWPTIASNTELFPDDWEPMTTIDGRVRVLDWPTFWSMLRISIIFFVSTIIWSSFAISSVFRGSSSSVFSYP